MNRRIATTITAAVGLVAVAVVLTLWLSGGFTGHSQTDRERVFAQMVDTHNGPHGDIVRAGYIACGDSQTESASELQDKYTRNGIGGDPWGAPGIESLLAHFRILCPSSL